MKEVSKGTEFSDEVYKHFGIDLFQMKESGKEHDWLIGNTESLDELTANMAGFGTEQSQRVIIDYDAEYGYFLVRRFPMDYRKNMEYQRTLHTPVSYQDDYKEDKIHQCIPNRGST